MTMTMTTTTTLAELTQMSGLDVLDHLEMQAAIPVINGLQAQGDLIIIPAATIEEVTIHSHRHWRDVPLAGVELLRSAAGGNPHMLVGDPLTCEWTTSVWDAHGLAIGALRTSRPAYLVHPEHGGTGIAPGIWVVRRQRERSTARTTWSSSRRDMFVAD